jgi:hypothetical protein
VEKVDTSADMEITNTVEDTIANDAQPGKVDENTQVIFQSVKKIYT